MVSKKVLFVNPAKNDSFPVVRIHMGFTLMGQILTKAGCEVRIMDYAFLKALKSSIIIPSISEVVGEFQPDVIGISVFTYLYEECKTLIDDIYRITSAPIILGGPHITIFPEDFSQDPRISYLVCGEAEGVILELVQNAERKKIPDIIKGALPCADDIPAVNLDLVYGSEHLKDYQIQLSRGCPFSCAFCNVELIAGGRKVRARNIDVCIDEIMNAKARYPNINTVYITDDCPNFDRDRFKSFLVKFAEKNTGCSLHIDNVRADLVDDEMLQLYVRAGGLNICLGTESGHPEVFSQVNKGEALEDVLAAISLIKKYKLSLGLCFVIGLPDDTLEKHMHSIALAKTVKSDYVYWNMCTPWPGTPVYEWFKQHGEVGDVRNFSTLVDPEFNFTLPRAWSDAFGREDRVRAWLIANLETYAFPVTSIRRFLSNAVKLAQLAYEYKIYKTVAKYLVCFLPHYVVKAINKRIKYAFILYKR